MVVDFYHSPTTAPLPAALALSQATADAVADANRTRPSVPFPLSLVWPAKQESDEIWLRLEAVFIASLRIGNVEAAEASLDTLRRRFGEDNDRIQAMVGMLNEAREPSPAGLGKELKAYDKIISDDPTNIPIQKRRIGVLKSLNRIDDAIAALVELVKLSPIDAEAWAELADLYNSVGLHAQAVYALEEVLLLLPNAWNIHARLGEVLFVASLDSKKPESDRLQTLTHSIRRFCRSIELCDSYLRGLYGLVLATHTYLPLVAASTTYSTPPSAPDKDKRKATEALVDDDLSTPTQAKALFDSATAKLRHIISQSGPDRDAYSDGERAAAEALLREVEAAAPKEG